MPCHQPRHFSSIVSPLSSSSCRPCAEPYRPIPPCNFGFQVSSVIPQLLALFPPASCSHHPAPAYHQVQTSPRPTGPAPTWRAFYFHFCLPPFLAPHRSFHSTSLANPGKRPSLWVYELGPGSSMLRLGPMCRP